jgi:hypothetical protein
MAEKPKEKPKLECKPNEAKFCIQFGFPKNRCCLGCLEFANSPSIVIDIDSRTPFVLRAVDRHLSNRATRLKEKGKKFTSLPFLCQRPWLEQSKGKGESIVDYQKKFIAKHFPTANLEQASPERSPTSWSSVASRRKQLDLSILDTVPEEETDPAEEDDNPDNYNVTGLNFLANVARLVDTHPTEATIEDIMLPVVPDTIDPNTTKVRQGQTHIQEVKVQNKLVPYEVPNGYVLKTVWPMTIMEKKVYLYKKLMKLIQGLRYHGGTEYSNIMFAVSLAGGATMAFRTLSETVAILFMGIHMVDSGICSTKQFDLEKYMNSFPSESYMRSCVYKVAAKCTISIAIFFTGKPVFLSSDKGMIHIYFVYMFNCVF